MHCAQTCQNCETVTISTGKQASSVEGETKTGWGVGFAGVTGGTFTDSVGWARGSRDTLFGLMVSAPTLSAGPQAGSATKGPGALGEGVRTFALIPTSAFALTLSQP